MINKDVDIETAVKIQAELAERSHRGYEDATPILEKYIDLGYDPDQIIFTLAEGVKELVRTYGKES